MCLSFDTSPFSIFAPPYKRAYSVLPPFYRSESILKGDVTNLFLQMSHGS